MSKRMFIKIDCLMNWMKLKVVVMSSIRTCMAKWNLIERKVLNTKHECLVDYGLRIHLEYTPSYRHTIRKIKLLFTVYLMNCAQTSVQISNRSQSLTTAINFCVFFKYSKGFNLFLCHRSIRNLFLHHKLALFMSRHHSTIQRSENFVPTQCRF